jgi:hypothetical protein
MEMLITSRGNTGMAWSRDDYMTVIEAARHFDVHENTIRAWLRDGYLDESRAHPGRRAKILISKVSIHRLENRLSQGLVISNEGK